MLALLVAWIIDQLWGELPNRIHPVVAMGQLITWLSRPLRAPTVSPRTAFAGGLLLAIGLPAFWAGLAWLLLVAPMPEILRFGLHALLLKSCFALHALEKAVFGVSQPLLSGDLALARQRLRSLCSRDPSDLSPSEVSAAAIESAGENLSDSLIAPLFFYALFGLPGAVAYRAVNTMDAMLGYRGALEWLGKAPARLDDLLNLIPARLTVLLLWLSNPFQARASARVWWRERGATESPNAGHPMAALAGLIGRRLEKPGHYRLGSGFHPPDPEDIRPAWHKVRRAAWLGLFLTALRISVLSLPLFIRLSPP